MTMRVIAGLAAVVVLMGLAGGVPPAPGPAFDGCTEWRTGTEASLDWAAEGIVSGPAGTRILFSRTCSSNALVGGP